MTGGAFVYPVELRGRTGPGSARDPRDLSPGEIVGP